MNETNLNRKNSESKTQSGQNHSHSFFSTLRSGGAFTALCAYLGMVGIQVLAIVKSTGGHFVYSLDDPYIHLALATRIRSGLYGINVGEPASPSSSILWPFLFVPFAHSAILEYLPLVVNVIFGVLAVCLLALCVRKVFGLCGEQTNLRVRLLTMLLVFTLNMPGLTLTGLEHVLELLLSLCCVYAVLYMLEGEAPPKWTLLAAAILPSVRYEGLLLTTAVAIVLCGFRRIRSAIGLLIASIILPVCFSVFLLRLHLPAFPLSVLLKSSATMTATGSLPARIVTTLYNVTLSSLIEHERAPELILGFVLVYLTFKNRQRRMVFVCAAAGAFVAIVQTLLGPNGWFFRYEIYALAFCLLVALAVAMRTNPAIEKERPGEINRGTNPASRYDTPSGALLIALIGLTILYMQPLLTSHVAARGIYEQQYQMSRLMSEFYTGPVAVNDLGLVTLRRSPAEYVFDLYGLGSYETSKVKKADRTPQWLDTVAHEHNVGLVALYPEWFKKGVPSTWKAVGKLCAPQAAVSAFSSRVMIYDTGIDQTGQAELAVEKLAKTLPRGTSLELRPSNSFNTCPAD